MKGRRLTYLDVVVGELAVLIIVHAEKLSFLAGTEMQTRNKIDGLGDDGGNDERVGRAGNNVRNLDVQRLEVVVDESARNAGVHAVEADDVVRGEEGVEDEADHSADSVLSEHVERIIDANEELNLGGEVAADAGDDSEQDRGPRRDEAGRRSGSDETRDGTGAPADKRPLPSQTEIENAPSHGAEHGRQAGVPAGHGCPEVGAEGRAAVEAQPAEPQEDGAESDEGDVVRSEVEHHPFVSATEDPRVGHGRHTGDDFDGPAAGVVEDSVVERPSVDVPYPARDGAVHQCRPEEGEDHRRHDTTTLGRGSDNEGACDSAELHLYRDLRVSSSPNQAQKLRGFSLTW